MSDVTIPGGKIRSFVERIENIDGELAELNEQKKEVFAEAKGEGFDVKILKEIIKLRKQDQDERDERESLLDLYMRAMETAQPDKAEKVAKGPERNEASSKPLMVRRRESAVSNHEAPLVPFILRDAASRLLRMRSGGA